MDKGFGRKIEMKRILSIFLLEIFEWVQSILSWVPGRVGYKLRYYIYRLFFSRCGEKVCFLSGCSIVGFKNIKMGNNICIGDRCQLRASGTGEESIELGDNINFNSNVMINADCGGKIKIGSNVIIGPNVVIRASNHKYLLKDTLIRKQGHRPGQIIIGDDVWIGANSVILPNAQIKNGAVIAAGSVVAKSVEEYTVMGGGVAKPIGVRK